MFLTVAERKIYYEKIGEGGGVIVMLHGWGGSRASLRPLATELQQNFTCYLFDLPGFGESDMPGAEWGIGEYARCMTDAIRQLVGENAQIILLGHSFGGAIALVMAANSQLETRNSPLFSRLIVIAPSWHRRVRLDSNPVKRGIRKILHTVGRISFLKKVGYRLFFPHSDMLARPDLESNFRVITTQDLTETVRRIKVPTLILAGDKDTYVPVSDAHTLHKLIPQSELKVYDGARHALPLEESARIAPDISHFAVS